MENINHDNFLLPPLDAKLAHHRVEQRARKKMAPKHFNETPQDQSRETLILEVLKTMIDHLNKWMDVIERFIVTD